MRVIGAGWGRTGTTSLAKALDRLGAGPCLQMQTLWDDPELADLWNAHHDGVGIDWVTALAGWNSIVDWLGSWQWETYAQLWPEAPIVLSVRDPDDWYNSVRASIHPWTAPGTDIAPPPVARVLQQVWDVDFGGWDRVLDRDHAIACFRRHNQYVIDTCPPHRLTIWTATQSWAPLCRALDVAEPDEPFPHLNQRS
jgi:Sulfotransferase domain